MFARKRYLAALGVVAVIATGIAPTATALQQHAIRGVVRAEATATISSELVARIVALPFKVGAPFKKDDVLVAFDCRRYEADLRAADAEAKALKVTVDQNRLLLRHRAGGANELAIAEAKFEQAQAAADSLKIRLGQCVIRAPYDGKVAERMVDAHELPAANSSLLKIVKKGNLELDLIVPSSWATWLNPGMTFPFRIDETNTEHTAKLVYLGAVVDPISRTMSVSARLLDPGQRVRPGMSGTARIEPPNG